MKHLLSLGIAALALTFSSPLYAQDGRGLDPVQNVTREGTLSYAPADLMANPPVLVLAAGTDGFFQVTRPFETAAVPPEACRLRVFPGQGVTIERTDTGFLFNAAQPGLYRVLTDIGFGVNLERGEILIEVRAAGAAPSDEPLVVIRDHRR